jgi:hypothetical protein
LKSLKKFDSLGFYSTGKQMSTSPILRDFQRAIVNWFEGIAIPETIDIPDDRVIEGVDYVYGVSDRKRKLCTEKVLKFNRKALRQIGKRKVEKVDPRYNGGDDTMILKVGKPGSDERKAALAEQYAAILASGEEVSPFGWEG